MSGSKLTSFTGYTGWSDVLPSPYSSSAEGKYGGGYNSNTDTFDILHVVYTPSDGEKTDLYISPSSIGVHTQSCGWIDLPCDTLLYAYHHRYPLGSSFTLYMESGSHNVSETETLLFSQSTSIEPLEERSGAATKVVSNISEGSDGLFVVSTHSITLSFTSISFLLTSLNCPLYYQSAGTLELNSVSVTPASLHSQPSSLSLPTPLLSLSFGIFRTHNFSLSSLVFPDTPAILVERTCTEIFTSHSTFTSISLSLPSHFHFASSLLFHHFSSVNIYTM